MIILALLPEAIVANTGTTKRIALFKQCPHTKARTLTESLKKIRTSRSTDQRLLRCKNLGIKKISIVRCLSKGNDIVIFKPIR